MTVYGENSRTPEQRAEFGEVGVISSHQLTPIGNVAIVAGKTVRDVGWEQVAYIVLTPEEWAAFRDDVDAQLAERGTITPKLADAEFRSLLDAVMCLDPTPLSEVGDAVLTNLLGRESRARGFDTWTAAYHEFRVTA